MNDRNCIIVIWNILYARKCLTTGPISQDNGPVVQHLRHNVCQYSVQRGNRCTQVYATDFGWARAFPMASRSKAHETLLLLLARDDVLQACICANAKEMNQGKFQ